MPAFETHALLTAAAKEKRSKGAGRKAAPTPSGSSMRRRAVAYRTIQNDSGLNQGLTAALAVTKVTCGRPEDHEGEHDNAGGNLYAAIGSPGARNSGGQTHHGGEHTLCAPLPPALATCPAKP